MKKLLNMVLDAGIWLKLVFRFGKPKKKELEIVTEQRRPRKCVQNLVRVKTLNFVGALRFTDREGFDNMAVLAHAFHESGKFIKVIGNHNYWGIKVPQKSRWTGLTADIMTHEYEAKVRDETYVMALHRIKKLYAVPDLTIEAYSDIFWLVHLRQKFIDFGNVVQALMWYADFIKRLYPNAFDNRHNPGEYFKGLVNGNLKYATDPRYVEKLLATYQVLKSLKDYEYIRTALKSINR